VELETNSKINNIRDLYRGINDFKKGKQPRTIIRRSFPKLCTLRLRGEENYAIVLIFATVVSQTSVHNFVCVFAGYVVPVLQSRVMKWKKKLTGVRSRAVTNNHTDEVKICEEKPQMKFIMLYMKFTGIV